MAKNEKPRATRAPLWWNKTATLRCREHLPLPGSESWWKDEWVMVPVQQIPRLAKLNGHPAECETCATLARDTAPDAHIAYLTARAFVADAITMLAAHLDDLDAREDAHQTDWSYAGTMNHVAQTIRDMVPNAKKGGA